VCLPAVNAQTSLQPQRVRFGAKIGAQLTESFNTVPGFNSEDVSRVKFGVMMDADFSNHFGAEVDALYKQIHFNALIPPTIPGGTDYALSTSTGHVFDFPVLVKWHPFGRQHSISPYVDAGATFRYLNTAEERRFFAGEDRTTDSDRSFAQASSFNIGYTMSAGFDILVHQNVRVSPELRWTAWARDNFSAPATVGTGGPTFDHQNNQLELLFGITF
jgi:outer membrane protein W